MSKRNHPSKDHTAFKKLKSLQHDENRSKHKMTLIKKLERAAICATFAFSVTACGGDHHKEVKDKSVALNNRVTGYVGSVTADEPQAALLAREILIRGGNAADAATALGLALTVTLPSRASLGGGGACLAYRPGESAKSILFLPQPSVTQTHQNVDRPAAIPMMARGLYLLHASYGKSDINDILQLVGNLAGNGIPVSDILASDLEAVQGPLFMDSAVKQLFTRADGTLLKSGDILYQPRLKIIYDRLVTSGVADLYIGSLARSYALGAQKAGGGLTNNDFRNALPIQAPALSLTQGQRVTYFVSPPADGGLGMALAMRSESGNQAVTAQGSVAKWRAENPQAYTKSAILAATEKAQSLLDQGSGASGSLPPLPASTSFSVVDRNGEAVSCALTMNNLFGTGRISGTTGIIMAASPRQFPQPLLTASITTYKHRFVAGVAASGQNDAAQAAASTLSALLQKEDREDASHKFSISHANASQGRVNAIYCKDGLPGNSKECRAYTDPNGMGLAISR